MKKYTKPHHEPLRQCLYCRLRKEHCCLYLTNSYAFILWDSAKTKVHDYSSKEPLTSLRFHFIHIRKKKWV